MTPSKLQNLKDLGLGQDEEEEEETWRFPTGEDVYDAASQYLIFSKIIFDGSVGHNLPV